MSKNTQIGELINYISVDGSGNVVFTTVSAAASNTDKFLVSDAGVLKFRTAAQLLSDIGAQASGSYQAALSGTGFVKISGTTISYDNSTYATQTYVTTAISNLVASAPSTLDTLNELATALGNDANFATTVATSIGTKQAQLNGTGFVKISGTTVSYDNATYLTTGTAGTTYVPYTGATANVNLGVYNLAGGNVNINGGGSGGGALRLKQFAGSEANLEGYNSISTLTSGVFYFTSSASVPNFKNFVLNPSGLTDNTVRTYALPDASGTLALTSNLSSYLPLAGGIMTGDIQMGNNQNRIIKFRTATAWDYTLKGVNDDFFITDNPGLNYLALYYNTGGNNRYASLMNVLNVYANGSSTFSGALSGTSAIFSSTVRGTGFYTSSSQRNYLEPSGIRISAPNDTNVLDLSVSNTLISIGSNYYSGGNYMPISLYAGNFTQLYLNTNGNVGIGIVPQGLLDVYKSTSGGLGGHIYLRNNGASVGNEMAVMFVDGDASTMRAAISSTTEGAPYFGDIKFKTGLGTYASLNTRMTISGEGKVGIGFTPSYKLQVAGEITTHAGTNTSYYAYMNYLGTTYNFGSGETTDNVDFKIAGGASWSSGGNFRWFTQTGGTTPTERFRLTPIGPAYFTNKLTVGGTGNYSSATLSVEGPVRANRSIYSWYQSGTNAWDGYAYLHLKTNMNAGGAGNIHYTMSLFYARLYSYSSNYIREGSIGFHNWSGSIYNLSTTGNIFYNAYTSSDGFVVLSLTIGSGSYMGVTVDWHQAYGYPFQDKIVTAASPSNSATGVY
jgi:hypothetical protein